MRIRTFESELTFGRQESRSRSSTVRSPDSELVIHWNTVLQQLQRAVVEREIYVVELWQKGARDNVI